MAPTIPVGLPASLLAGATWTWTDTLRTRDGGETISPADAWTITFYLVGHDSRSFTVTAQTDDFLFTYAAASTGTVEPGNYRWDILGVLGSTTYRLVPGSWNAASGDSVIRVEASPVLATGTDGRTHNEKMLALIESELEARITGVGSGHESYTIDNRAIGKIPAKDLHALRMKYQAAVTMERNSGRLPPYAVHFVRP